MTDYQWQISLNPHEMLKYLMPEGPHPDPKQRKPRPTPPSKRKLQLYCEACCRMVSEELGFGARTCIDHNTTPASNPAGWAMAWAGNQAVPTLSQRADLLREIFGNSPHRPVKLLTSLSSTVLTIAQAIYDQHTFDDLPYLADMMEEEGCDNLELLMHLRNRVKLHGPITTEQYNRSLLHSCWYWDVCTTPHVQGCWALDLILGKS